MLIESAVVCWPPIKMRYHQKVYLIELSTKRHLFYMKITAQQLSVTVCFYGILGSNLNGFMHYHPASTMLLWFECNGFESQWFPALPACICKTLLSNIFYLCKARLKVGPWATTEPSIFGEGPQKIKIKVPNGP